MADSGSIRVLITGFGPFPGVPDNPAAHLARELTAGISATSGIDAQLQVLPTEWQAIAGEAPALLDAAAPDIALHLGLCRGAHALRIERSAFNRADARSDARGALPGGQAVLPGGAARLDSPVSVLALARHLRAQGHTVLPSLSAGRYLCNFLYYLSLDWAARQPHAPVSLFLHIPPTAALGGHASETALLESMEAALRYLFDIRKAAAETDRAA